MPLTGRDLSHWRALYQTFDVDNAGWYAVPRPKARTLRRFEARTGIKLSGGYRGYVRVFGAGCLVVRGLGNAHEIDIWSPDCANHHMDLVSAAERVGFLKVDPSDGGEMAERGRRLVLFAQDSIGHCFGWDPQEVTDPAAPEFGVYAWYRANGAAGHRGNQIVKVANTFRGFIKFVLDPRAVSEHRYEQVYREEPQESEWGPIDRDQKRVLRRAPRP
jgi:hypothetical protein